MFVTETYWIVLFLRRWPIEICRFVEKLQICTVSLSLRLSGKNQTTSRLCLQVGSPGYYVLDWESEGADGHIRYMNFHVTPVFRSAPLTNPPPRLELFGLLSPQDESSPHLSRGYNTGIWLPLTHSCIECPGFCTLALLSLSRIPCD